MSEEDGLIGAHILDGKGGARDADWPAVLAWAPKDSDLWIHLDRHGARTESWLHETSGLTSLQVDALLADETRPRVAFMGEGALVTLRGVNLNPGADPDDMVSLRIWVDAHRMVSVRLRRLMAVNDVRERLVDGKGPVSTSDLLRMLANGLTNRMNPVIEDMNDEVDSLEDEVVDNAALEMRHRLKQVRRQAIALRRYLAPQRDAIARLHIEDLPWIGHDQRLAFRESAEQVARIVEELDSMRERAAVIQDELANRLADRMNRNMYTLSVVAALMLPLGVITGMLGMNVGGIPLADDKHGMAIVVGLMACVVAAQVYVFRRMKWL